MISESQDEKTKYDVAIALTNKTNSLDKTKVEELEDEILNNNLLNNYYTKLYQYRIALMKGNNIIAYEILNQIQA